MAIELRQQLRLTQQLVMTPQLQQAIKLLQLNQLELVNLVQQELQENPVLEEAEVDEETPAERDDATPEDFAEGEPSEAAGIDEAPGGVAEGSPNDPAEASPADEMRALDELPVPGEAPADTRDGEENAPSDAEKIADVEWESYLESNPMTGLESRGLGGEDERPSLEATYARRPSLAEHLEWQLQVTPLDDAGREIAHWIIGNIDERGFLRSSVEEIARQAGADEADVEAVLAMIQTLDPTGVAARDLRECLLIQIDTLKVGNALVRTLVEEHLDMLQKRDFRGLTRATGATLQEVADAARVVGGLEPRPGRGFGGEESVYITPDIYVYKVGDDFHVLLNEDGLPKLRINSMYRDVLSSESSKDLEKDTRNYVHDKVRSAMWLIKSIHQRQRTIYKVMQSIISFQRDFFERGIAHLKPLNLRDVADDIEMHESTVSRVTTNKYVHTPQGIFELKYFFNSSIGRFDGGEALASESVKERIRKIIESEDPMRPMSDQRIAEMLKAANIDIARRTVTKYREAMNILSSTKRRQIC
ncbi:MAG TPA: RNA polymerase sigma-54 factor [Deltaproteobacteria bacterium]|nr:RNA polymerase sigma-54 factor [Deltaproteobacteria bacterium]